MSLHLGSSEVLVNLDGKTYKMEYFDPAQLTELISNAEDVLEENLTENNADTN